MDEGLVTGMGNKVRGIFFNESEPEAMRTYLAARGDALLPLYVRHDPPPALSGSST